MSVTLGQIIKNNKDDDKIKCLALNKTDNKVTFSVNDGKYTCVIENSSGNWDIDTKIKCKCSCPDFQFRWAYVLWKHKGLLDPNDFILEPPKHKNPGMVIGACKHLNKCARNLLTKN